MVKTRHTFHDKLKVSTCINYCWNVLPPKKFLTLLHVFKIKYLCMVMCSKSGKSSYLRTSCSVWEMTPAADIVTGKMWTTSACHWCYCCCYYSTMDIWKYMCGNFHLTNCTVHNWNFRATFTVQCISIFGNIHFRPQNHAPHNRPSVTCEIWNCDSGAAEYSSVLLRYAVLRSWHFKVLWCLCHKLLFATILHYYGTSSNVGWMV